MSFLVPRLLSSTSARTSLRALLVAAFVLFFGSMAPAADLPAPDPSATIQAPENSGAHEGASEEEHGMPLKAMPMSSAHRFAPTNSMIVTWIVTLGIIIFAQIATRRIKEVPEGAQNFWEFLVEGLYNFLENIVGHALVKKTFWFFATVFIFILATNWFGLLPGIGTIGWGIRNEQGALEHITRPLFRGASADLNLTFAMAIVFFASWIYWTISSNGVGGALLHVFGNPARGEMKGFLAILMALVFLLVGLLEVVSILFRPVSLSFRLFGNIFAGENVLESMAHIVPGLAWLIPLPFYFLELLVGFVQAMVFTLLTAVFTLLMCKHDDSHDAPGHSEKHAAPH